MSVPIETLSASNLMGIDPRLWDGVRRLVCRMPMTADVRAHRLESLALAYWPGCGRVVPPELVAESRAASPAILASSLLLERIRAACSGPLVLIKGPEVAACYPRPGWRPFGDLDLLVPDAVGVQHDLIAAGFRPVGEERLYVGIHHLRPLHLAGYPLVVEIHARPKWVEGLRLPDMEELFAAAVSASSSVDGVLALPRAHHCVVLAAHSWAHEPLGSLRQLIDIAAVRQGLTTEPDLVAARWDVEPLWTLTSRVIDALLLDDGEPWPLRAWGRNLLRARDRTMLEVHLERWISGFSVLPPRQAAAVSAAAILADCRRGRDEPWRIKVRRSGLAVRHAFRRQSEHDAKTVALGSGNDGIGGRPWAR